jgi:hypothetical protein
MHDAKSPSGRVFKGNKLTILLSLGRILRTSVAETDAFFARDATKFASRCMRHSRKASSTPSWKPRCHGATRKKRLVPSFELIASPGACLDRFDTCGRARLFESVHHHRWFGLVLQLVLCHRVKLRLYCRLLCRFFFTAWERSGPG